MTGCTPWSVPYLADIRWLGTHGWETNASISSGPQPSEQAIPPAQSNAGVDPAELKRLWRTRQLTDVPAAMGLKFCPFSTQSENQCWEKNTMTILRKFIRSREEPANTVFRYIKALILPVAMLVIFRAFVTYSSGLGPASTSDSASHLWVVSGLVRVGKTGGRGTASSISLSSARGETVDTQVVLR